MPRRLEVAVPTAASAPGYGGGSDIDRGAANHAHGLLWTVHEIMVRITLVVGHIKTTASA